MDVNSRKTTQWFAGVALMGGLIGCSAPQPVIPDGRAKVPVNSADRIQQYQQRMLEEDRGQSQRVQMAQELQSLREQVAQLKAAAIVLAADAEGKSGSPLARAAAARLAGGLPSVYTALVGSTPSVSGADQAEAPPDTAERPVTAELAVDVNGAKDRPVRLVPVRASAPVVEAAGGRPLRGRQEVDVPTVQERPPLSPQRTGFSLDEFATQRPAAEPRRVAPFVIMTGEHQAPAMSPEKAEVDAAGALAMQVTPARSRRDAASHWVR